MLRKGVAVVVIKKCSPDDWQQYKELRLQALQADPLAFGSEYEEEVDFTEDTWRQRCVAMYVAIRDNNFVGMVGLLTNPARASKHKAMVVSFWVKPAFRGQGIGKALLIELQQKSGYAKLFLDVTTTQIAAIALYEAVGFKKIGLAEKELFKDGRYFDQYIMEWLS
jgi:ribosomal protein S18 acetylase RimI-like enzyme